MNDKLKHFLVGLAISLMCWPLGLGVALIVTLAVGVGKEVYDWHYPEQYTADWVDAAATLAGWLPVAVIGGMIG